MPVGYRELYEEGRRILEAVPIPDAALDARLLLEKACGTGLQTLLVYPEQIVDDVEAERYRALIERRRLREPTAMILGEWDFMGLTFKVTRDTLIPEQDTEVLVETVLRRMKNRLSPGSADPESPAAGRVPSRGQSGSGNAPADRRASSYYNMAERKEGAAFRPEGLRILDLCTGSGCILLSLLWAWRDASGIGTDISDGALSVARENADRLGLAGRALFCRGDLWEALPAANGSYTGRRSEKTGDGQRQSYMRCQDICPEQDDVLGKDSREDPEGIREAGEEYSPGARRNACAELFDLVVSNPPYVPTDVIPTLEPEVRCGEPYEALDGGADGLDFYRRIIAGAPGYLTPGGLLALESGFDEAADIAALMEAAGFVDIQVDRDYGRLDRVVSGRRKIE